MIEKLGLLCCCFVEVVVFVTTLIAVIAVVVIATSICYRGRYCRFYNCSYYCRHTVGEWY